MIIVRLMGGLGNQLFQYAAARRLAHCSNAPLKLDLSWFESSRQGVTPRTYALHRFNILEDFASPAELPGLSPSFAPLAALVRRFRRGPETWLREKQYHFDPDLLVPRKKAYLDGYWQSEKYFRDIREILLEELAVRTVLTGANQSVAERLQGEDISSVAVHVRRGDYVSNPSVTDFHGCCSLDYYRAALDKIASAVRNPHFFVFSDDPAWVERNFPAEHPFTQVTHNGPEAAHEDLRLMTLCRHHVIANSSFSWWGAWLSGGADKMVIAPKRWFAGAKPDAKDVVPESWIKI